LVCSVTSSLLSWIPGGAGRISGLVGSITSSLLSWIPGLSCLVLSWSLYSKAQRPR
jgi:hypothetical protein